MATIDILISVDGAKLAQQISDGSLNPGTQSAPTSLGAYGSSDVYISMVSQDSFASNNQGQSELTVTANGGDSVRWAMTTFGNNQDYTVYLYADHFNPSSAISALSYANLQNTTYLPASGAPTGGTSKFHNQLYVAQGMIQQTSVKIQYTLSFAIIDNANGNTLGYFTWDPFIQVN